MLVNEGTTAEGTSSPIPGPDAQAVAAPERRPPHSNGLRNRVVAGGVAVMAAFALFVSGMWFTNHLNAEDKNVKVLDTPADANANRPSDFISYKGKMPGVRIEYPTSWTLTSDSNAQIVLGIQDESGVSIRRETLESRIDTSNMKEIRAITDAILGSPAAKLQTVTTNEVTIHGLPGIFYLYYYGSGSTRGVHAHYFLFDKNQMYSLVFQVTPADQFQGYANTFDQVLDSFATF